MADGLHTAALETVQCARCGAAVAKTNSRRKYCDGCRAFVKADQNREHMRRKARRDGVPVKVAQVPCERCGDAFLRRTMKRVHCDLCRVLHRREVKAAQARRECVQVKRERSRRFFEKNRERVLSEARVRNKTEACRARRRETERARRRDPAYLLKARIRLGIYRSLRGRKNGQHWEALVGYSLAELVAHLERQFTKGMSWENMGEWHIDHIVPCVAFNLTGEADDEFLGCWALSNLRPIWREDNLAKGGKRTILL